MRLHPHCSITQAPSTVEICTCCRSEGLPNVKPAPPGPPQLSAAIGLAISALDLTHVLEPCSICERERNKKNWAMQFLSMPEKSAATGAAPNELRMPSWAHVSAWARVDILQPDKTWLRSCCWRLLCWRHQRCQYCVLLLARETHFFLGGGCTHDTHFRRLGYTCDT